MINTKILAFFAIVAAASMMVASFIAPAYAAQKELNYSYSIEGFSFRMGLTN